MKKTEEIKVNGNIIHERQTLEPSSGSEKLVVTLGTKAWDEHNSIEIQVSWEKEGNKDEYEKMFKYLQEKLKRYRDILQETFKIEVHERLDDGEIII